MMMQQTQEQIMILVLKSMIKVRMAMRCMKTIPTKVTTVIWNHFMTTYFGIMSLKIMEIIQEKNIKTVLEERIKESFLQGITEEFNPFYMNISVLLKYPITLAG